MNENYLISRPVLLFHKQKYDIILWSLTHSTFQLCIYYVISTEMGLPWRLSGKETTCQCRRHRLDPWVRKMKEMATHSSKYSCLGNPMVRGAWRATVSPLGHRRVRYDSVTKQQQQQSTEMYSLI